MPIICDTAKVVFFPIPGREGSSVKLLLWLLNRPEPTDERPRRVDNKRGYRMRAYAGELDDIPEGYQTITLIKDPVRELFDFWYRFAKLRYFERHKEVEALTAANLPLNPTFEQYLRNFDAYREHSTFVRNNTQTPETFLGPDISRFDRVFHADQLGEMLDHICARAGVVRDPAYPPIPWPVKLTRINPKVLDRLATITAPRYAYFGDHFAFDDSDIVLTSMEAKLAAAKPLDVMGRVVVPRPIKGLALACMLKEHPDLVRRFVSYYKDLGFSAIHLYFDDPEDPMIAELANDPIVMCHPMDADFWEGHERRNALEARQKVCFMDAYNRHPEGWLLCCDADEFIWPDRPMDQILAEAPASQRVIRARSGEPVWRANAPITELFSADLYRRPIYGPTWRQTADKLYGEARQFFKWGLLSHIAGKYLVRCGLEVEKLATHRAYFADGLFNRLNPTPEEVYIGLIHYDAMSFPHWQGKLERRLIKGHSYAGQSDERILQVKAYRRSRAKDKGEALFRALYTLDDDQIAILKTQSLLWELKVF